LESRENTIKSSLEDAEKAKQELERLNTESEAIISEARSEAQSIRVEAKSAAEKIKADIMAQAGEDAKKLRDETEKQIQVEKDKAISEIRQEVVGLTITVAEKVIRKNLSKEDNQGLIEDSLKNLKGYDA
jgi:F-type H+-transporting ATPase subunit b